MAKRSRQTEECTHEGWAPACPFCCTPHVAFTEDQLKALVEFVGLHGRFSSGETKVFEPFIKEYYRRNLQES